MNRIGIFIIIIFCFFSCAHEEGIGDGVGQGGNTLTLTYTIPDATAGAVTRAGNYVESAANESKVDGLHLLFFEADAHGNGAFVAVASAALKDADLKQNAVIVTLPAEVNETDEYAVLVIANLASYITDAGTLTTYLTGFETKTYGQAMAELEVALPQDASLPVGTSTTYTFPGGILPMSGVAVKPAGKTEMSVDLLRAAVRIDVTMPDLLASYITLNEVQLRNVASVIPCFRTQEEITVSRVSCTPQSVTGNKVTGGLYAVETLLNVSDPRKLLTDATCLLVNVEHTTMHTGANIDKTWYRINLNVNDTGIQYLKRNNAYKVMITGIFSPGSATPEEAYYSKATLIDAVTIPMDWKSSGVVTPPDVVIQ